jgi:hypothetical protein
MRVDGHNWALLLGRDGRLLFRKEILEKPQDEDN